MKKLLGANNNIIFASDYYPFGETLREYTTGTNKYKFTEKERDTESGYDYFGARYYNNRLGVWLSVDPLADKYPGYSGYNYCINNPLRLIDPTGMSFVDGWVTEYKANWNGDPQYDDPDGKKKCIGQTIAEESNVKKENTKANFMKSGSEFQKGHLFGGLLSFGKGVLSALDLILYQAQLLPEIGIVETGMGKSITSGVLKEIENMEGHVLERMEQRGISKTAMLDALKNPLQITETIYDVNRLPSFRAVGRDATVVINPETNKIISTWKTSSKDVKKLLGQ